MIFTSSVRIASPLTAYRLRSYRNINCGRCQQPLFTGEPIELTTATFSRHVERSDLPLLVDFWAPWCGPCKMMAPQFQQAARQLEPRIRLAKVNTEAEPHLAAQFGIRSIPTLALFQGGRESHARQAPWARRTSCAGHLHRWDADGCRICSALP